MLGDIGEVRLICIKVVIFLHSSEIICNFAAKNYMSVV